MIVFVNDEQQAGEPDAVEIDTYVGGRLVFYNLLEGERESWIGLSLTWQPDLLVAFDSAVPHEVKPVTHRGGSGVMIATWFLGEDWYEPAKRFSYDKYLRGCLKRHKGCLVITNLSEQ